MSRRGSRSWVHRFFEVSVAVKGIDALLQIAAGILLLLVSAGQIHGVAVRMTQLEMSHDPNDLVARFLHSCARHLSAGSRSFASFYLVSHGAVKLGLVVGLLRRKASAYPAAIIVFVLFIAYQLYRWTRTHSIGLMILTVVDAIVIVLTWLEYRRLKKEHLFA